VAAEEAEAALESSVPLAVLSSQDLWCQQLWRWLYADAKAVLRVVSKNMRGQVDRALKWLKWWPAQAHLVHLLKWPRGIQMVPVGRSQQSCGRG
jgi:hypothetical protein